MNQPLIIAEVSSNHHQDLERCLQFVDAAADLGCGAVKFQLFRIAELFAPEVLAASAEHRARERWELDPAFLPHLVKRCRQHNIAFSCTPFYLEAVAQLQEHVDFYKIASYELLWHDLLSAVAATGKPVVLSTGMANLAEVQAAVACLRQNGCADPMLLHCSSAYPTPIAEANLKALDTLRRETGCRVGWSDHTRQPAVLYRAVFRWGAECIEFHLDLEGDGPEFSAGHCWLPKEIGPVITTLRQGFEADGDGHKQPAAKELPDRDWRADPSDGLRPMLHIRNQPIK